MGQRRVQVTCRARTPSSLWFSVWPLGLKSGHPPVSLSHPPPNRGPWDHSLYRKCFSYSQGHFLCLRSLLDPESGGVGVCPGAHPELGEAAVMADAVRSRTLACESEAWLGHVLYDLEQDV